ncbi:MAG: DNA-directed RNA polymerase [Thaumarchaeota archaeon]|jgi:DNA-directed RNA polymerase subunit E'|nr:DNA-directed RNA polymerase [Nitrososphaerota archaeon]
MFEILTVEDIVRIPPSSLGGDFYKVAMDTIKAKYESTVSNDLGYIIRILDIDIEKMGKILHGDGGTYHRAVFNAMSFYPELGEVVDGEVVEITDFGAFIKIGPVDALLHISQVMDDYINVDLKGGMIVGQAKRRQLKVGSRVRAKIIAISMGKGTSLGKIGVTCRQPYLGAHEWIEEDLKKAALPSVQEKPQAPTKSDAPKGEKTKK